MQVERRMVLAAVCLLVIGAWLAQHRFSRAGDPLHSEWPREALRNVTQQAPLEERTLIKETQILPRVRRVRIVDERTDLALDDLAMLAEDDVGIEPLEVRTDEQGWVALPSTVTGLAPRDGFAFVPCKVSIATTEEQIKVQGQFKITLNGGLGLTAYILREHSGGDWLAVSSGLESELRPIALHTWRITDSIARILPTEPVNCCVAVPGARMNPAHSAWVGTAIYTIENGVEMASVSPGRLKGLPIVSAAFQPQAGDELSLDVELALPQASVEVRLSSEIDAGLLSLKSIEPIADSGSIYLNIVERRNLEAGASEFRLVDLAAGRFELQVAVLRGRTLWVSVQRFEVRGQPIVLHESSGQGAFQLPILADNHEGRALLRIREQATQFESLGVDVWIELSRFDLIAGLRVPQFELRLGELDFPPKKLRPISFSVDLTQSDSVERWP